MASLARTNPTSAELPPPVAEHGRPGFAMSSPTSYSPADIVDAAPRKCRRGAVVLLYPAFPPLSSPGSLGLVGLSWTEKHPVSDAVAAAKPRIPESSLECLLPRSPASPASSLSRILSPLAHDLLSRTSRLVRYFIHEAPFFVRCELFLCLQRWRLSPSPPPPGIWL